MRPSVRPQRQCAGFLPREAPAACPEYLPKTGAAAREQWPGTSQLDPLHMDLRFVINSQPQLRRILHVARLADISILVWVAIVAQNRPRLIEDRDGSFGLALRLDDVDQLAVHRDRVGADHQLLGIEAE